ncbi:MAG TPA: hypothetical protein PL033_20695 [Candidatus Brocadiia bacterium]|nr:hypothetical protein [Candidatus Brocadiia bacterium]
MFEKRFLKKMAMALAAAILLTIAGSRLDRIRSMRREYRLTADPIHGVHPKLVLATQVLAAFRGLILDVVWIRGQMLMDQGKYYELVQLSHWACELNPRFPRAWAFNAWNCAYNVSVEMTNMAERWRWVDEGIRLLRDKGIPWNPDSSLLYFELGYIYMHKIADVMDDAHGYYKRQLASYYHGILGGAGPEEQLVLMAAAPKTLEELKKDPRVAEYLDKCRLVGVDIIEDFFDYIRRSQTYPESVRAVVEIPAFAKERKAVDVFCRARKLREECKLDPEKMLALVREYGPFDWRLAQPHAIYWAHEGMRAARRQNEDLAKRFPDLMKNSDKDRAVREIDFDRIIYGSMSSLLRFGEIVFDSNGQMLPLYGPNFKFADKMCDVCEQILKKYGDTYMGLAAFYENFLIQATIEFYLSGNSTKSREYYAKLQDKFPNRPEHKLKWEFYISECGFKYMVEYRFGVLGSSHWVFSELLFAYRALACNDDNSYLLHYRLAQQICKEANKHADQMRLLDFRQIDNVALRLMAIDNRYGLTQELRENLRARVGKERLAAAEAEMRRQKRPAPDNAVQE